MKVLITYFSLTGNTALIAEAIHEQAQALGHDARLATTAELTAHDMEAYDLVFLGSACHDADLARPVKQILDEMGDSPAFKLAGFCTHATQMAEEGGAAPELYERWAGNCIHSFRQASDERQVAFLGYFHCQGAPSPPIETFIHSTILTDDALWEPYIAEVRKHPTAEDLERARAFCRRMLRLC